MDPIVDAAAAAKRLRPLQPLAAAAASTQLRPDVPLAPVGAAASGVVAGDASNEPDSAHHPRMPSGTVDSRSEVASPVPLTASHPPPVILGTSLILVLILILLLH